LPQKLSGKENMMMDTSELDPAEYLRRLFDDVEFSYLVVVAAQPGVADLLASGARSIADLSAATGADAQALYRVLRALASRGLFREDGGKRFSLTPLADPLRQDAPQSIRPQAMWSGSEAYRRTWGDLSYSVRTGEPAFDHVYGKPFFDYLAEQPALAKIFNDVMTSASSDEGAALAAAHDFSGYRRIVDVAGAMVRCWRRSWTAIRVRWECFSTFLRSWRPPMGPSTGTSLAVVSKRWQATSLKPCYPAGTPTC